MIYGEQFINRERGKKYNPLHRLNNRSAESTSCVNKTLDCKLSQNTLIRNLSTSISFFLPLDTSPISMAGLSWSSLSILYTERMKLKLSIGTFRMINIPVSKTNSKSKLKSKLRYYMSGLTLSIIIIQR